jgi:transcriptional regulator with XRE-family HTH domain
MYIGKRIEELRKARGMKLIELAEKSGVQIATLSRMEHMKMTGTLESHMQIAKALEVDVTHLYTNIIKEENKAGLKTRKSATDIFVHSDKSSYEILASKVLSKRMMPILLKIEPAGSTHKEQNQSGAEKFIFVLEGKIEARIGAETYALSKTNSLYFDASREHWFVNKGKATARALCVGTPVAL